ncbi:MAG: redoxin domain-containing protein [Phycisphaerales bacterium]
MQHHSIAACIIHSLCAAAMLSTAPAALAQYGGGNQSQPARARSSQPQDDAPALPEGVKPYWLDKIDAVDRAFLNVNLGYAPAPITDEMKGTLSFPGGEAFTWEDLRGKVVVVQSWTSQSPIGRAAPQRTIRALEDLHQDDYVIVAIHTPEGAEKSDRFIEQRDFDARIIVDAKGTLLDELGMYQRPENVVIDRNGTVRYVGLSQRGLKDAVGELAAEAFDENAIPTPRPAAASASEETSVAFPEHNREQLSATNLQGQRAPELAVERWINGQPDPTGKVVIIDFWATWCGPCVASIPHMNDIANRFRNDLVAVGLSDEPADTIEKFMRTRAMEYPVATDTRGLTKRAMAVRGIPHVMVMSSDWTIRWQGRPANLNIATVQKIVDANRALISGTKSDARYRWSGSR